ncbi:MAG: hypothetical protein L6Q29_02315 [Candidatus Pacebacteria bacterium]|nr:hypothetical protein [Candidatus Paceibacterota bacterium]NUQ57657.1 hypothetical protein [Candidatus Paceibacter sp.]
MKQNFENKIDTQKEQLKFFENPEFEKRVEKFYSDAFPYHNFGHAKESMNDGRIIVANCRKEGISIDDKVVYYADFLHDAGWHENHKEKGFSCKEEYSAHLAGEILKKFGEDEETISRVQSAIWATHRDRQFVTNEEKAVRAADLAGIAKDYETFLTNAVKLKLETEMLSGQNITWKEWQSRVKKIVEFYLNQDIKLTSAHDDENGESVWHKKVRENLEKFLREDDKAVKQAA